ncbi:MAG: right-handed parallel beta-helix repeat-containing protein [Myxococcales bacterium]
MCLLLPWVWPAAARAQVAPEISLNGELFPTLAEAVAAAASGQTVTIGAGVLTLSAPIALGAGVSIEGASAHATLLDAAGLEVGIRIAAADPAANPGAGVRRLEVSGALRGIEVTAVHGVVIRNVVLRDNQEGVYVGDDSEVTVVNATLVRNGTGIFSAGSGVVQVRNSVITAGGAGLSAMVDGKLISSYDDLFGNTGPTYLHVQRGIGDLTYQPIFMDLAQNDLRLADTQAITDRGDPADDFAAEPEPNGRRINLGAFGGTAEAELSMAPPPNAAGGGCSVAGIAGRPKENPSGAAAWALLTAGLLAAAATRRHSSRMKTSLRTTSSDGRSAD